MHARYLICFLACTRTQARLLLLIFLRINRLRKARPLVSVHLAIDCFSLAREKLFSRMDIAASGCFGERLLYSLYVSST